MLRSSGYLRYAQDLAWIHSESAGFGREWYAERRLTWLVKAIELQIVVDAAYGTELTVSTDVVGFRRVWARRRSEFRPSQSDRTTAVAVTDWVLLDGGGRPVRPPQEILDIFVHKTDAFAPLRVTPGVPDESAEISRVELAVRLAELDPMGHVNNAAYLDYLDDQFLGSPGTPDAMHAPRRYRAEFVASAEPASTLTGSGWPDGHAWHFRLTDAGGRELLRARLETGAATRARG